MLVSAFSHRFSQVSWFFAAFAMVFYLFTHHQMHTSTTNFGHFMLSAVDLGRFRCQDVYGEWDARCRARHDFQEFNEFITACHWIDGRQKLQPYAIKELSVADDTLPAYGQLQEVSTYGVHQCYNDSWNAYTVGSFWTEGGNSWTSVSAFLSAHAVPQYEYEDYIAISHYIMGNLNEDGALLGYPPIHQHHFHLFDHGDPQGWGGEHSFHGDWQCHSSEDGITCALFSAPPGHAFFLRKRIGIWAEFNDVRLQSSEPLKSSIYVSFKVILPGSVVPLKQVATMFISVPLLSTRGVRLTHNVITAQDSVVWSHRHLPPALSEIFFAVAHSHMEALANLMLFQGSPDKVFSYLRAVDMSKGKLQYGDSVIDMTMQNIRQRMIKADPASLACSYFRDMKIEWIRNSNEWQAFPRASTCLLNTSIRDHVVVAMYRKRFLHGPSLVRMHANWFLMFSRKSDDILIRKDLQLPLPAYLDFARTNQNWSTSPERLFSGPFEVVNCNSK